MDILLKFLLLSITFYLTEAIFEDCGSKGKVSSVTISGCEGKAPCPLKKGTNASIAVNFDSEKEMAKSLQVKIYGLIAGIPVPFSPPVADGCKDSGIACPVVQSKTYSYKAVIPVLSHYPSMELVVKYELLEKDHNNDMLFCVTIPCEIV